jgi:hypothetical protein
MRDARQDFPPSLPGYLSLNSRHENAREPSEIVVKTKCEWIETMAVQNLLDGCLATSEDDRGKHY